MSESRDKQKKIDKVELEFIRLNCMTMTDVQMAKDLNRDVRTICAARKRLGIKKVQGGKISAISKSPDQKVNTTAILASQKLNEKQRKEFFKTQLVNDLYYTNLKLQLTEDELNFYLEEWGSLCVQFEDIVATEKRQIDEYIKTEIMGNRTLRNIKIAEEEIGKITKEVQDWRTSHPNIQDDEEVQERDVQLMMLLKTMHSQSATMASNYESNVSLKNKLLNELNARRRDRIDQITRKGTTFLSLVQDFRDKNTRESQGRHMELVRLAKEKKKSEWRKVSSFPDGSRDCILMDENSEVDKVDVVRMSDKSFFCDSFTKQTDQSILVVEDDFSRSQFFSEIFKNNKVDFASNSDKALDKLKTQSYDLICLDYDLGIEKKGAEVAQYISDNNLSPKADILIHSMNKEGAEDMAKMLVGRNIEVCPFPNLIKNFKGKENA